MFLNFSLGLYRTATTLPVLIGHLRMSHYSFIPIHKCLKNTIIDTLTIGNSRFEHILFQKLYEKCGLCLQAIRTRLRAVTNSYELRSAE